MMKIVPKGFISSQKVLDSLLQVGYRKEVFITPNFNFLKRILITPLMIWHIC